MADALLMLDVHLEITDQDDAAFGTDAIAAAAE